MWPAACAARQIGADARRPALKGQHEGEAFVHVA